jgi:protein-S-isoprenylcysteine O-methyltransferase
MNFIHPFWFAAFYGVSEVLISIFLRSRKASNDTDKGTLARLWMVINVCMVAAMSAYIVLQSASFADRGAAYWIGLAVFIAGIAVRWYSIAYLGRFFTVDVAVAADQKVIDTGPYRHVRHPSYSGVLLAFLGIGLLMSNYVSLFLVTVPIAAVFLHRIKIEEAALTAGLGENYRAYMQRTRRLIPFVY